LGWACRNTISNRARNSQHSEDGAGLDHNFEHHGDRRCS
jgi:hypothetical protein